MDFITIKSAHLFFVMLLAGTLLSEWVLLSKPLQGKELRKLLTIDALYGISALLVLITGFYMALSLGKGRDFYFDNPAIFIKIMVFVLIGALSIYPTITFIRHRQCDDLDNIDLSPKVRFMVLCELLLLFTLPFFAVLLASGSRIF